MSDRDGIPIILRDGNASPLSQIDFSAKEGLFDERWIQKLVFDHPECVPIRQIEPGFGTLISICRELPTAHGPIDNLLMTCDGDIVIVEAKLWRNPQARREVVAQALDYASCIFRLGYEQFEAAVRKARQSDSLATESLYQLFSSDPEVPDQQHFIDAVATNLTRGNIAVIVLGDGIRSEVKLLTEILQSYAGFHFTFALVGPRRMI